MLVHIAIWGQAAGHESWKVRWGQCALRNGIAVAAERPNSSACILPQISVDTRGGGGGPCPRRCRRCSPRPLPPAAHTRLEHDRRASLHESVRHSSSSQAACSRITVSHRWRSSALSAHKCRVRSVDEGDAGEPENEERGSTYHPWRPINATQQNARQHNSSACGL